MRIKFSIRRIGFELVAFVMLATLKLKGVIQWPWWQVTMVLWLEVLMLILGILSLLFLFWVANKMDR